MAAFSMLNIPSNFLFIYKYIEKFAEELHIIKQWATLKKDNSESHVENKNGETPLAVKKKKKSIFLLASTPRSHCSYNLFFLTKKYKRDN